MAELRYFTHVVDEQAYGAWYREIGPREIEVIGVGLLEVVSYAGFSPEATARSVLENHVRQQLERGTPMPSIKDDVSTAATVAFDETDDAASLNDPAAEPAPRMKSTSTRALPQPVDLTTNVGN